MAETEASTESARPLIIGPDSGPEAPFPLRMGGKVVSGFGRGSKELGIPTANLPVSPSLPWLATAESGVYFGWAGIQLPPSHPDLSPSTSSPPPPSTTISSLHPPICPISASPSAYSSGWRLYPFVMSIGFNPFYKNTVRSAEVHILNKFEKDFYGCEMRIVLLGFIRKELDYTTLEALVKDIGLDIEVAGRSLNRFGWEESARDEYLWGVGDEGVVGEEEARVIAESDAKARAKKAEEKAEEK